MPVAISASPDIRYRKLRQDFLALRGIWS